MAIARIALFPGGTEENHHAIVEGLGETYDAPVGRLLFAAGPAPGGWQIVQVWESRETMDAWVQTYLGPAMGHAGSRGYPAPPQITDVELTEVIVGASAPVGA